MILLASQYCAAAEIMEKVTMIEAEVPAAEATYVL